MATALIIGVLAWGWLIGAATSYWATRGYFVRKFGKECWGWNDVAIFGVLCLLAGPAAAITSTGPLLDEVRPFGEEQKE